MPTTHHLVPGSCTTSSSPTTWPPPAVDLVAALETSTDPVQRARRALILAEHRRGELVLWYELLRETGQPRPSLTKMIAHDEAYQRLVLEAYA